MSARKVIGAILVASVFGFFIVGMGLTAGWLVTLGVWCGGAALAAILITGLNLLLD